jgi:hypothetical protein
MKKYYLALFSILFTTISCGQAITSVESLYLLALLDYRYKVTIGGTFFGNYNADVKTVALSSDGKCDRTLACTQKSRHFFEEKRRGVNEKEIKVFRRI